MRFAAHLNLAQAFGRVRSIAAAKRLAMAQGSLPTGWWMLPAVLYGTLGWAFIIKGLIGWMQ